MHRFVIPSLAVAAALTVAACGVDPTTVDTSTDTVPAEESPAPQGDQLVHPDTPVEDIGDDPDSDPVEPVSTPVPAAGSTSIPRPSSPSTTAPRRASTLRAPSSRC